MRMLINQFAAFHESYDYYNCIYNYLLERGIYVEISIEKYFDAYNKLETQANIFKPYLSTEINAEQNMYPAIFSHSIDNNLYIYLDFTFIKQAGNGGQNIIVEDQISHVSGQNFDYGGHNSSDGTGNGANGWQINASEDHSSHASCQNFFYSSQNSFDGSQDN
uniref:Uncharacterized protein n=1 Tax=Meloidogyne hapla TaxID=6305 RepID=A0A1I8BVI9_MELHA